MSTSNLVEKSSGAMCEGKPVIRLVLKPASPNTLARPKSANRAWPSRSIRMFFWDKTTSIVESTRLDETYTMYVCMNNILRVKILQAPCNFFDLHEEYVSTSDEQRQCHVLTSCNFLAEGYLATYVVMLPWTHNGEMSATDGARSRQ